MQGASEYMMTLLACSTNHHLPDNNQPCQNERHRMRGNLIAMVTQLLHMLSATQLPHHRHKLRVRVWSTRAVLKQARTHQSIQVLDVVGDGLPEDSCRTSGGERTYQVPRQWQSVQSYLLGLCRIHFLSQIYNRILYTFECLRKTV